MSKEYKISRMTKQLIFVSKNNKEVSSVSDDGTVLMHFANHSFSYFIGYPHELDKYFPEEEDYVYVIIDYTIPIIYLKSQDLSPSTMRAKAFFLEAIEEAKKQGADLSGLLEWFNYIKNINETRKCFRCGVVNYRPKRGHHFGHFMYCSYCGFILFDEEEIEDYIYRNYIPTVDDIDIWLETNEYDRYFDIKYKGSINCPQDNCSINACCKMQKSVGIYGHKDHLIREIEPIVKHMWFAVTKRCQYCNSPVYRLREDRTWDDLRQKIYGLMFRQYKYSWMDWGLRYETAESFEMLKSRIRETHEIIKSTLITDMMSVQNATEYAENRLGNYLETKPKLKDYTQKEGIEHIKKHARKATEYFFKFEINHRVDELDEIF